jgi:hypothetical protein
MEKSSALTTPETDTEEQSPEAFPDASAQTPETTQESGKWDTSPEAAMDVVAETQTQLDTIQTTGEQDEARFQREAAELRDKAEANAKEIAERKTTVETLVSELLNAPEDAEVEGKTTAIEGNLEAMEKLSSENGTLYAKLQDLVQQRSGEAFMNMRRLNDVRNHVGEYLSAVLEANTDEDAREEIERVSAEVEETITRLDSLWDDFNAINSQTTETMSTLGAEGRKIDDARTAFLKATALIAASDKKSDESDTSVDEETLKSVQQTLKYGHTDDLDMKWDPSQESRAA